jgi:hypothetical protein
LTVRPALFTARVVALLLAGIATSVRAEPSPAVPPLALGGDWPAVAAEYRSTLENGTSTPEVRTWRFWRETDRIEREGVSGGAGERWERDGATLFLTRLYHGDRKGIEYRSDDLEILNAAPAWAQLSLLVDPTVLTRLAEVDAGWRGGVPVRHYAGTDRDARWDVTVRTDLMLPVEVRVTRGASVETLELVRAMPRDRAAFEPRPIVGYELIDYADLGDRERDPFVMRVTAAEGYQHGYAHGPGHGHDH